MSIYIPTNYLVIGVYQRFGVHNVVIPELESKEKD